LNQNVGINTSAYSSSQQSLVGVTGNHKANLSANTGMSPAVSRGTEIQNADGEASNSIFAAQAEGNLFHHS